MSEPYQLLERKWSQWVGLPPENMVVCSSGTAALHLALETFRAHGLLEQDSQVIVPDYTMIACPRAVMLAGMQPLLLDCDESSYQANWRFLLDSPPGPWTLDRPFALMPVHIYGEASDMRTVWDLRQRHGCPIIEDCAEFQIEDTPRSYERLFSRYESSDATCWSFYQNKVIAGEEGGAVAFACGWHAGTARRLRSLGMASPEYGRWYEHQPRGMNYRLSNANARAVLANLAGNLPRKIISKRRELERRLIDSFSVNECPGVVRNVCDSTPDMCASSPWVLPIELDSHLNAVDVAARMNVNGVPARPGFLPIHRQWEFCDLLPYSSSSLQPHSNRWRSSLIYLPLSPSDSSACQAAHWCDCLSKSCRDSLDHSDACKRIG